MRKARCHNLRHIFRRKFAAVLRWHKEHRTDREEPVYHRPREGILGMFRKTQQVDECVHDRHVRDGAHPLPHDGYPLRPQTLRDLFAIIVRAHEYADRLGAAAGLVCLPDALQLVHERGQKRFHVRLAFWIGNTQHLDVVSRFRLAVLENRLVFLPAVIGEPPIDRLVAFRQQNTDLPKALGPEHGIDEIADVLLVAIRRATQPLPSIITLMATIR